MYECYHFFLSGARAIDDFVKSSSLFVVIVVRFDLQSAFQGGR